MASRAAAAASTGVALNPVEARLSGGLLALNRLIMTFQNKRMPVAGFTVGRDGAGVRATILLECPPETAQRYVTLLSGLEDVEEVGFAGGTVEVALLETGGEGWRESARQAGICAHADAGTVIASGEPEKLEAWLGSLGEETRDIVRLGPVARPGDGG
jgi:hypothetical protein